MAQPGGCSVTGGPGSKGAGGRGSPSLLLLCPAPTVSARWQVTLHHEGSGAPSLQVALGFLHSLFSLGFCNVGLRNRSENKRVTYMLTLSPPPSPPQGLAEVLLGPLR